MGEEIRGKRAICEFTRRDFKTLLKLKATRAFPLTKLGGIWVSDSDEIARWRRDQLTRRE